MDLEDTSDTRMHPRHLRWLRRIGGGAAAGGLMAGLWGWGLMGFLFAMNAGVLLALGMSGALDHGRLRVRARSLGGLQLFVALPCALVGHAVGLFLGR